MRKKEIIRKEAIKHNIINQICENCYYTRAYHKSKDFDCSNCKLGYNDKGKSNLELLHRDLFCFFYDKLI